MADVFETFLRLYKEVKADWDKGAGDHWWIVPLNAALERVCEEDPSHTDPARFTRKFA
jgi:hypothetical protein